MNLRLTEKMIEEAEYARKRKIQELDRIHREYQEQMRRLTAPPSPAESDLIQQKRQKLLELNDETKQIAQIASQSMQRLFLAMEANAKKRNQKTLVSSETEIKQEIRVSDNHIDMNNKPHINIISHSDSYETVKKLIENYISLDAQLTKELKQKKHIRLLYQSACSNINLCSETWNSISNCLNGSKKRIGPNELLKTIKNKAPEIIYQISCGIAKQIINVFCSSLDTSRLRSGDIRFGLVYMTIYLCYQHKEFKDILFSVIFGLCPFAYPGFMTSNRLNEEINDISTTFDIYLLKKQGVVAFLAALCQFKVKDISQLIPQIDYDVLQDIFPFGGLPRICFCWKFIAGILNSSLNRLTPYLLVAFFSVASYEMKNSFTKVNLLKLIKVINSDDFHNQYKIVANFDSNSHGNDVDRYAGFKTYFKKIKFKPPGKNKDCRILANVVS